MALAQPTKGKILIVEDENSWRRLYEKTLSSNGYWPISCASLATALDVVARNYFHAGVIDIRLVDADPGNEDGLQVIEQVSKLGEDTGLIVLTAYGDVRMTRDAFKRFGVSDFLEKNGAFLPDKFLAAIDEAVQKSRTHIDGRKRTQITVQNWIKGLSPRDVEVALASGGFEAINSVIDTLLYDLYPLRLFREEAKLETTGAYSILTAHYWSRYLGQPVTLHMGNTAVLISEIQQLESAGREYTRNDAGKLTGVIYVNDTLSLDDFEK